MSLQRKCETINGVRSKSTLRNLLLKFLDWFARKNIFVKIIVILGIIGLAIADYYAIFDLFVTARMKGAWIFACVFASAFEGLPTIMSIYLVKWKDKANYKVSDIGFSKLGFWVSFIGYLILYGIMVFLRISIEIGWMFNVESNFVRTCILSILPLGTSIFAFVLSWLFFRAEMVTVQAKIVSRLEENYSKKLAVFRDSLYKLQDARVALWTEVTEHKTLPQKLRVFRDEIFKRTKSKIIEDCITDFPNQIERFNQTIESELDAIIQDMKSRSTVPADISGIKVSDIVSEYSMTQTSIASKWKYNECKSELEGEFISLINNAIQVAQLKAFIYPIEEDTLI